MPQYVISFDAHAMDHIPDQNGPVVAGVAHVVVREAMDAGVWCSAGDCKTRRRASRPPTER